MIKSSPVCVYAGTYVDADILARCPPGAERIDSSGLNLDQITERMVSRYRRPARTSPGCAPVIRRSTPRWPSRPAGWTGPGWRGTSLRACRPTRPRPPLVGRELTVPEVAQTVILTRTQAASTAMPETESLAQLAASRATLVLHLAIRRTRELAAELTEFYGADCPVVVVADASKPSQLVLRGSLADIADQVEQAGLRQAAVIIVGWALDAEGFTESHLYRSREIV